MIRKQIGFRISIHAFIFVSLLTEILNEAVCLVIRKQDTYEDLQETSYLYSIVRERNTTSIETVKDNDPDYPYEQLLQLVKDTKRILSSSNGTTKMKLNLDPRIYDAYLSGDFSDTNLHLPAPIFPMKGYAPEVATGFAHASSSAAGSPAYDSYDLCTEDVQYKIPQRLTGIDDKDYFIINVGSDLTQKYNSVICKYPKSKCGALYAVQDYSLTCDQGYNRIRNFISIPVGNQISIDQQRLQSFRVPDSCYCKATRNPK